MDAVEIIEEPFVFTIRIPLTQRRIRSGCVLYVIAFMCCAVLAVLALFRMFQSVTPLQGGGVIDFVHPRRNHFGFLWMVTFLATAFSIPWYVRFAAKANLDVRFDAITHTCTLSGKSVLDLRKIEYIEVRPELDPDGATSYRLLVSHTDGNELPLASSYDEARIRGIAQKLARFLEVRVAPQPPQAAC